MVRILYNSRSLNKFVSASPVLWYTSDNFKKYLTRVLSPILLTITFWTLESFCQKVKLFEEIYGSNWIRSIQNFLYWYIYINKYIYSTLYMCVSIYIYIYIYIYLYMCASVYWYILIYVQWYNVYVAIYIDIYIYNFKLWTNIFLLIFNFFSSFFASIDYDFFCDSRYNIKFSTSMIL